MSLDPLTFHPNSLGPKRLYCHHLLVSLLTVSLISIGLSDAPAQQFSIGTSFQATTLDESGFIVPDTMGAVGNGAGLPSISVPNGFTPEGLPTGIQFMGRPYEENLIIAVARGYQSKTDWHLKHPETLLPGA